MLPDAIQIGTGIVSAGTLLVVLRLTFQAGQVVQKIDDHERRIGVLEIPEVRAHHAGAD